MFPTLIFDGERTGPDTLAERAERAASGFAALGVGEGDVIAVMLRNEPVYLETMYAARALGAYLCPVNWHFRADEAGFILRDCGAKALVIDATLLAQAGDAIAPGLECLVATPTVATRSAFGLRDAGVDEASSAPPQTSGSAPRRWPRWEQWRDRHPRHVGPPMRPRGMIPYTSGTTGRPKGVRRLPPAPEFAARQADDAARLYRTVFALDADSRALLCAPLYHSAPASYLANASQVGSTLYLVPRFDAQETLALIERERISHAYLVPTMFQRMLRLPAEVRARYDLSSMRFVISTGSPCLAEVKRAMIDWWGPVISECYASSETGYATFIDSADWLAHPGSVGRALGEATVRVLDDDGTALPAGAVGTIHVHQPAYPDFTYIGNDEARRRIERDGLVSVGDMGWFDAQGYLYISDRKSDMVISGGVNIYPAEIEATLAAMPEVADCAVFGIPDEEFGEALAAAVQLREGRSADADAVRAFLRARIAGYKVPRLIEFHASLPREDTGKIFKRKLRDPHWQGVARRI
ncbi:MAG: AMP-binding protein [Burkholderiaceae bacterium]|nr:AMP-binding protein [Burkholderiaceae bacterium]